ncbi:MAG: M20 family metallopeptidase [Chloroflexota bacterium]
MTKNLLQQAETLKNEIVRLRRDIHQNPELGFEEVRTAALVADTLAEIGYDEIKTQVGRTGVVAQIGTGDGPTIGIRADMDALPIHEATNLDFSSQTPGVMHACGHDSHTAMLLGAAHLLHQSFVEEGTEWNGNVRLLFQPCEEKFDEEGVSGATAMIADEALANVDHVIALHIISTLEAGVCQFHDGYGHASVDSFEVWIRGDGGHGAYPHEGSDPLFILSTILPNIYGIPSRYINPLEPCVVSLGQITAGSAPNVIPSEVYVQGTIRAMKDETREKLWAELEKALQLSESLGGSYELVIHKGYPAGFNTASVNDWMRDVVTDFAGSDKVLNKQSGMGAEDFSYMALEAPGAMFNLGANNGGGNHHTPVFDIDESVLPLGSAILAETARRYVMGKLDK